MEAVKKYWFWGILISILSIFAMSHNASATNTTINLNNFALVRSVQSALQSCTINGGYGTVSTSNTYCESQVDNATLSLVTIETDTAYEVKKGDILTFYFFMTSRTSSFEGLPVPNVLNSVTGGWDVIGYETVLSEDYNKDYISSNGYINGSGTQYTLNFDLYTGMSFYRIYEITLRARADGNYKFGLNGGNTALWSLSTLDFGQKIRFSIRNFSLYRFSGDEANKEQEEKTQEAVNDSQAAGGSSSQDAQTGTTGLLNAITGAVNVISAARPTNCKINGNMGNLDMGQLDLCANPAPAFVQTIGSLILILMCVPLAISLFNRFITIFRSFQS